jgi:hypothetical protein
MPRLKITPSEIQKYLALLEETPERIAQCIADIDPTQLSLAPGPRGWSALEILAHLRACEDLWSYSIYAMLVEEQPTLPLFDERRWAKVTRYASLDFPTSFQTFKLRRSELVRVLQNLPEPAWTRCAVIEGRQHTVFSQVRRMALHEQEHCTQIEALFSGKDLISDNSSWL